MSMPDEEFEIIPIDDLFGMEHEDTTLEIIKF
jgi:hypothetical protein